MAQDFSKLFGMGGNTDTPNSKSGLKEITPAAPSVAHVYSGGLLQAPNQNGMQTLGKDILDASGDAAKVQEEANQLDYQRKEVEYQQQEQLDQSEAANALATYHQSVNSKLPDYMQNFAPNGDVKQYMPGVKDLVKSSYEDVFNSLSNPNAQRKFQEASHSVTVGAFGVGQDSMLKIQQAQIVHNQNQADSGIGAALYNNPLLSEKPQLAYAQSMLQVNELAKGMSPEDAFKYTDKKAEELSVGAFTAMGQLGKNGEGAEKALSYLNSGMTLNVPAHAIPTLKAHLQEVLTTIRTKNATSIYQGMKDASNGMVGAIMNKEFAGDTRKNAEANLLSLATGPMSQYATGEQKLWATHELNAWHYADLAASLNPANKYEYEHNIEAFNPDNPKMFKYKNGDPTAAKEVYTVLKSLGSFYQQEAQTGRNVNGQVMTFNERMTSGVGPRLAKREIDDAKALFMGARSQHGTDEIENFVKAAGQFSDKYHGDNRLVIAGYQQLYNDDSLGLNKQRILALQAGQSIADPATRRHLIASSSYNMTDLTKGWNPKDPDRPLDATDFSRKIANNGALSSIMNNPALGVSPDQVVDMRALIEKSAAVYVNKGMTMDAAINKSVNDVLPGKVVGNMLIGASYDSNTIVNTLNMVQSKTTTLTDATNPLRVAAYAARKSSPNILQFLDQNGAKPTVNAKGEINGYDPTQSHHNPGSMHYKGSANDPGAVDVDVHSVKDVNKFITAAQAAGFNAHYDNGSKTAKSSGAHIHLSKADAVPLDPAQRVRVDHMLRQFQTYGSWITDPANPGQAVLPVVKDENGISRPLLDINKEKIRVYLQDMNGYSQLQARLAPPERRSAHGFPMEGGYK